DGADMMLEAEVVDGRAAAPLIEAWLSDPKVAYLHAHYARLGILEGDAAGGAGRRFDPHPQDPPFGERGRAESKQRAEGFGGQAGDGEGHWGSPCWPVFTPAAPTHTPILAALSFAPIRTAPYIPPQAGNRAALLGESLDHRNGPPFRPQPLPCRELPCPP
ncbi:MAG: DUF1203 domain-containing protein, partial [Caulobacteraceae bacterium]